MRERRDSAVADQRAEALHINSRRLEQGFAERCRRSNAGRPVELPAVCAIIRRTSEKPLLCTPELASPRMTSPGAIAAAGQHLGAFDRADAEAGQVIIAGARTCPAFPRSRRRSARSRPGGSLRRSRRRPPSATAGSSFAGGEIIEEEQRLGALDDEIVGAHRDQVDADAVVAAECRSRASAWCPTPSLAATSRGSSIARRLQVEKAAEPAKLGIRARPRGRLAPAGRSP